MLKRGNSLFQKILRVIGFSVLLFQCQHQTAEPGFSLGIMLLLIRSSLPAFQPVCNMMQNPGAGLHT